ncbi:MAG: SulP family inorganic anion transporter [Acidimicrobiales bacterium]
MKSWFDAPRPTVADVIAGISVALVLIPQSLAYAQIAEMPVVTGLFASALPLIAFSLFASSPYLQTGPVALTSLLTLAALQGAGFASDNPDYVKLGALLAFIVGICRLVLGLARLGWMAYLISEPVRKGFTSAAAIIIISSQLPKALGSSLEAPERGPLGRAIWSIVHPGAWTPGALLLSALTLAIMLGGRRMHRLFPGVAVAVLLGLAYSRFVSDSVLTVGDTNPIPEGLPSLSIDLPWSSLGTLAVGGLIIALIGFAEPASIARQFAQEDKTTWDANRELASSGIANVTSALSGAFPVGGSFSRSSVNRMAGARTRWSGGVTGVVVLAFLSFASILDGLPQAVLGAIVIGAVLGLVQPVALIQLWRQSRIEAVLAWTTFCATLLLTPSVQWAVLLGVALTAVVHFVRPLRLLPADDGQQPDSPSGDQAAPATANGHITVKTDGLLWLGSYGSFEQQLRAAAEENPGADIVVDLGPDPSLDPTVESAIKRLSRDLVGTGRSLSVAGLD